VPSKVLVCPGTYTENITLTTPDVDVIAVAQNSQQEETTSSGPGRTVLNGTLTISLASGGSLQTTMARWQGIDIRPSTGRAVLFTGADAQYAYITDCARVALDAPAITGNNTGQEAPPFGPSSVLDIQRCRIESQAVPDATVEWSDGAAGFFVSPILRIFGTNIFSLNGLTPFAVSGAIVQLDTCRVQGDASALDESALLAVDTIFETAAASIATVDPFSLLDLLDCKIQQFSSGDIATGTGSFFHDALALPLGFALMWSTTLTVTTHEGLPQEQHIDTIDVTAGPVELTGQVNVAVVGPGIATLPPTSERPGVIRAKQAATSLGAVTLGAQGVDTIRVAGAAPVASVTLDDDGLFLVSDPPNTTWEAWSFGAIFNCLSVYLVSPSAALAPYQSIQAAYNAAKAAGADPTSPAKVLVCPGIYTEDVTMDQAGIDIVAVAIDKYNMLRNFGLGITRLVGSLTIDLGVPLADDTANCAWRGIDIIASVTAIDFTGTNFQMAFISDCLIRGNDIGAGLLMDNSGVGLPGSSVLDCIRCRIEQPSAQSGPAFRVTDGILKLSDCVTESVDQAVVGGSVLAEGTQFFHGWSMTDAFVVCEHCKLVGLLSMFATNGGGVIELMQCQVHDPAGGPNPTGIGTLIYDEINWSSAVQTFGVTATLQKPSVPAGAAAVRIGLAAYTITSETNIMGTLAGQVFTLPLSAERNGPVRIKPVLGLPGGIFATTSGGETINGAPPGPFAIPVAGATFIADPTAGPPGNWETYG
jgi:hypothetical protein